MCLFPMNGAGIGDAAECIGCIAGISQILPAFDYAIDKCAGQPGPLGELKQAREKAQKLKNDAQKIIDNITGEN